MSKLTRFSASVNSDLLVKLDAYVEDNKYPTRSKAIEDMIRNTLVEKEWSDNMEVVSSINIVYNHHKRELVNRLTDVQHDYQDLIISSQHIHLDHDNCFEIIIVKGRPAKIKILSNKLKAVKGVKHLSIAMASTGREI